MKTFERTTEMETRPPFSISFLDQPLEYLGDGPDDPLRDRFNRDRDHKEEFASSLYEWKQIDYESSGDAPSLHCSKEEIKSRLWVYYVNPNDSDNFEWWPMYNLGDSVALQDHMPWYDHFRPTVFDRAPV